MDAADILKPVPLDQTQARSFRDAKAIVHDLERILHSYEITICSGTELEALCLELQDMEDKRLRRSPLPSQPDYRSEMARAMGLLQFAELVVSLADQGRRLDCLVPHLRLLNESSVAQNVRKLGDDSLNKLFELLIALGCLRFATKVRLDNPHRSIGDNPDVMFHYGGINWAFACKVPNSESMQSAYDNIADGVRQIDRSDADCGLVLLNARNWIKHDEFWPPPGGARIGRPDERDIQWAWKNPEMTFSNLQNEANRRFQSLIKVAPNDLLDTFAQSKKSLPAFLMFLQSATLITTQLGQTLSRVGILVQCPIGQLEDHAIVLVNKLNEALFRLPSIPGLK